MLFAQVPTEKGNVMNLVSTYGIEQAERDAFRLKHGYCESCRDRALFLAQRDLFENQDLSEAHTLVSTALDILMAYDEIKPCQNVCWNSGSKTHFDAVPDLDEPEQHKYQADNYADWSEEICSRCGDMRYAHKK